MRLPMRHLMRHAMRYTMRHPMRHSMCHIPCAMSYVPHLQVDMMSESDPYVVLKLPGCTSKPRTKTIDVRRKGFLGSGEGGCTNFPWAWIMWGEGGRCMLHTSSTRNSHSGRPQPGVGGGLLLPRAHEAGGREAAGVEAECTSRPMQIPLDYNGSEG